MNRLECFAASIVALWATLGWAADAPSADDSTEEMVITAKRREALQAFVSALAEEQIRRRLIGGVPIDRRRPTDDSSPKCLHGPGGFQWNPVEAAGFASRPKCH